MRRYQCRRHRCQFTADDSIAVHLNSLLCRGRRCVIGAQLPVCADNDKECKDISALPGGRKEERNERTVKMQLEKMLYFCRDCGKIRTVTGENQRSDEMAEKEFVLSGQLYTAQDEDHKRR